jgi:hypothetical protein
MSAFSPYTFLPSHLAVFSPYTFTFNLQISTFFSQSVLRYPLSAIRNPLSAIRHPPSAIRHPPSAIRHPLSAIRYPLSAIRYPLSAIRHPLTMPELSRFLESLSGCIPSPLEFIMNLISMFITKAKQLFLQSQISLSLPVPCRAGSSGLWRHGPSCTKKNFLLIGSCYSKVKKLHQSNRWSKIHGTQDTSNY